MVSQLTAASTLLASSEQHSIIQHFADAAYSSIMKEAPAPAPTSAYSSVVTKIVHVNPFADVTEKIYEYLDKAIDVAYETHALVDDKIRAHIPLWIRSLLYTAGTWSFKTAALVAAFLVLGMFAYQTTFNTFHILGITPPTILNFYNTSEKQLEERKKTMTYGEQQEYKALLKRKDPLDDAITNGGWRVWGANTLWTAQRVFFGDGPFIMKLAWAVGESVLFFTIVPLAAALVVRAIVPAAYKAAPWLCEKVGKDAGEVVEKANDRAESTRSSGKKYPEYVVEEEELAPGDYMNEAKRVGYAHRAKRAGRGTVLEL
jgi:hypothetical protein